MAVEKNDVEIAELFNWGTEFVFGNEDDEVKTVIYMRIVGDADMNRARVYSLRKSRELRLRLFDKNSDEHVAMIPLKEDYDAAKLVDMIAMFSMKEITRSAVRSVKIKYPSIPDEDASLQDFEDYQHDVDTFKSRLEEKRLRYISEQMKKLKQGLSEINDDDLYDRYVKLLVDEMCQAESLSSMRAALVYYGTYIDNTYKTKYFDSIEQVRNLPTEIKNQFETAYQSIDIGDEKLKKLRGATQ